MTDWREAVLVATLLITPAACATLQTIEPVQRPPRQFQADTTVTVQFVAAELVIPSCFAAGAWLPAVACRSVPRNTIIITNPCAYPNDNYASRVCHEMAHANGWPGDHSNPPPLPKASDSPEAKAWAAQQASN